MRTIRDHEILAPLLARLTRAEQLAYLDELLARAHPIPITGCYLWDGWDSGNGYGNVELRETVIRIVDGIETSRRVARTVKVHRLTRALRDGAAIPPGVIVDHGCRMRACINPDHGDGVSVAINTHRGAAVLFARAA